MLAIGKKIGIANKVVEHGHHRGLLRVELRLADSLRINRCRKPSLSIAVLCSIKSVQCAVFRLDLDRSPLPISAVTRIREGVFSMQYA